MPPRIDDPTLSDDERLYRRIWNKPEWINLKAQKDGVVKPSSVAFLDPNNEVSVSVASMTTEEEMLANYPEFGLVSILAGTPRALDHIVATTPEVDDVAHRVVCPPTVLGSSGRKKAARKMADAVEWCVFPESYRS